MKSPAITSLYSELVPAAVSSKKLLIVLHGLGDSMEGYRFLPDFLGFRDLNYLLVNAPDAYFTGHSWFDLDGNIGPGVQRSRVMLTQTLDGLLEKGWLPGNIGLFGFSQGALMSLDVGLRYRERLASIIAISGFVYDVEKLPAELGPRAPEVPILVTHGTFDPLLPLSVTKAQITEMRKFGLNIRWEEYPKEHTIDPVKEAGDIRDFLRKTLHVGKA